jgi:hypothetical protein
VYDRRNVGKRGKLKTLIKLTQQGSLKYENSDTAKCRHMGL